MGRIFRQQAEEMTGRAEESNFDLDWLKSDAWGNKIVDLTKDQIGYYAKLGAKRAGSQVGITMSDYMDRPRVREALLREAYKFAESAGDTSVNNLRLTLEEATSKGESIPQIARRIQAVFGFNEEYEPANDDNLLENWRAEMIARTETANAQSAGNMAAWTSAGVESKEWLLAPDACPVCEALVAGQTAPIPMAEPFVKAGTVIVGTDGRPFTVTRDVYHPPLHPNDRCAMVPVLGEEQ
jgi:hypothetical protein